MATIGISKLLSKVANDAIPWWRVVHQALTGPVNSFVLRCRPEAQAARLAAEGTNLAHPLPARCTEWHAFRPTGTPGASASPSTTWATQAYPCIPPWPGWHRAAVCHCKSSCLGGPAPQGDQHHFTQCSAAVGCGKIKVLLAPVG